MFARVLGRDGDHGQIEMPTNDVGDGRRVAPTRRQGPAARLTAEAGIVVFKIAFERWINETNQQDFPQLIRISLDELKDMTSG